MAKEIKFDENAGMEKWNQAFLPRRAVISDFLNKNEKSMSVIDLDENRIIIVPSGFLTGYKMKTKDPEKNFRKAEVGERYNNLKIESEERYNNLETKFNKLAELTQSVIDKNKVLKEQNLQFSEQINVLETRNEQLLDRVNYLELENKNLKEKYEPSNEPKLV